MKTKLFLICFCIFANCTTGYSQGVIVFNTNDKDCTHIIDGLVSSPGEDVPGKLAHLGRVVDQEKLEKLGFGNSPCVMVKSSADTDIENFIYIQVHEKVQQIGTQYKIPIAVNGKLTLNHIARRSQLNQLKPEQIKVIKFLSKAEAKAKYGEQIVFGLIEITV